MPTVAADSESPTVLSPAELTHLKQLPANESASPRKVMLPPALAALPPDELSAVQDSPRVTAAIEILSKSSRRKRSSSRPLREQRSVSSLMNMLRVEEERQQSENLKALVKSAVDRVEAEMQRVRDAETRRESAERNARDLAHRLAFIEGERQDEYEALVEQKRRLEVELRHLRNEMVTLHEAMKKEEDRRRSAEESASKSKHELRNFQAREQGREEGKEMSTKLLLTEMKKQGFEEGRKRGYEEGYEAGQAAGYEEGLRSGRKQGFREGKKEGKQEERAKAMQAFNQFLLDEMEDKSVDTRIQRTREWTEALDQASDDSQSAPSPVLSRRIR